jgi:hypothetical protein
MADSNKYRSTIQSERLIALLRAANGRWVPLTDILGLGIAQYSARIWECRKKRGLDIENRTETIQGVRHSWFRLVESSAPPVSELVKEKTTSAASAAPSSDWFERATGKPRPSGNVSDLPLFDLEVQS